MATKECRDQRKQNPSKLRISFSLRWKEGKMSPPHPTSPVHQMEIPLGALQGPSISLFSEVLISLLISEEVLAFPFPFLCP